MVYLRSIEKTSVTKVKGDDVTEVAGPGHTQPLLWDFDFLLSERVLSR